MSTMPSHPVGAGAPTLALQDAVATITLRRPAHRNRLHADDLRTLMQHFRRINDDRSIRMVVLTAEVPAQRPVFCAGYHIGEHGQEHPDATFEQVADAIEALRPVTVCALNGSVYGGATDFVLACDFAIGVTGMEMRMPAAALGLHYYPGGVGRFVSRLGVVNAKRAFLGAETFAADELLRMGYVQQLATPEDHATVVAAKVQQLLALAPLALETLKVSLNELARGDAVTAQLRERMHMTQASQDFINACQAFGEKRTPVFTGQ